MYVRAGSRAANSTDSHVQARTAPQNRRQKHLQRQVSAAGKTTPRAPPAGLPAYPACSGSQPPQQAHVPAVYPRCTFHALLADPAPPGNAVTIPDPLHQTQTHPIASGQHENDTRRKSRSARPSPGSADESTRISRYTKVSARYPKNQNRTTTATLTRRRLEANAHHNGAPDRRLHRSPGTAKGSNTNGHPAPRWRVKLLGAHPTRFYSKSVSSVTA
jgi:hypothetical protein